MTTEDSNAGAELDSDQLKRAAVSGVRWFAAAKATTEVLQLVEQDPALAEPLPGADDYIGAEVVYAASHEGALHLEDVLARRTRISIEAWDRGESAAPVAAKRATMPDCSTALPSPMSVIRTRCCWRLASCAACVVTP